jgi:hypothetical protein
MSSPRSLNRHSWNESTSSLSTNSFLIMYFQRFDQCLFFFRYVYLTSQSAALWGSDHTNWYIKFLRLVQGDKCIIHPVLVIPR